MGSRRANTLVLGAFRWITLGAPVLLVVLWTLLLAVLTNPVHRGGPPRWSVA